jgi:hypothetical protein
MEFALPSSFWPALNRLAGNLEWPPENEAQAEALVGRTVREGLLSLLFLDDSLPPVVKRAAEKHQALDRTNRLRCRVFEDSLMKIVDLLEGESMIILKGTDYAYRLYPAPHVRPRTDIDVLVRRERVPAVASRLKSAGIKPEYPAGPVARVSGYHEAVFHVGNVTVEVHHSFIQRARNSVDYEGVWRRATTWSGLDTRLLQLDAIDTLVYHAINMSSDQFTNPLFRHLDVWLLLHDQQEVLPAAVARAKEWATRRALYGALRQTSRYFPELQTPAVENAMRELLPSAVRAFLDRWILPDPWLPRKPYSATRKFWKKFWLIDDAFHRAAFLLYQAYAVVAGKLLELRDAQVTDSTTSGAE